MADNLQGQYLDEFHDCWWIHERLSDLEISVLEELLSLICKSGIVAHGYPVLGFLPVSVILA